MKHSEAVEWVRKLQIATQKARSIQIETIGGPKASWDTLDDTDKAILTDLSPFLFGPGCILIGIEKVLDRVEEGGQIEPGEFRNFMYIVHYFSPEIDVCAITRFGGSGFPLPDYKWLRGWELEDEDEDEGEQA